MSRSDFPFRQQSTHTAVKPGLRAIGTIGHLHLVHDDVKEGAVITEGYEVYSTPGPAPERNGLHEAQGMCLVFRVYHDVLKEQGHAYSIPP